MGRAAVFAVVATLALVALPAVAAAQAPGSYGPPGAYQPPPGPPPTAPPAYAAPQARNGFVIGFGIGGGSISAVDPSGAYEDEQYEGLSFDVHIGGMLSPAFALLGEVWGVVHHENADEFNNGEFSLTHNIFTIAAQFWVTPRFWLKGGLGRASYTVEDDFGSYESEGAPAFMGALGYELSHARTFAIDLQLRFGVADYEDEGGGELHNGALVVGFNWY